LTEKDNLKNHETLSYSTYGENKGESIIFLHGFMGSGEDWRFLTDELKKSFYCIVIDLPGHGSSLTKNIREYSFENCAENIISILKKLNIKRSGLIGYSMGGRVGLYTLLKYPDFFNKIILESANPGIENGDERLNRQENDRKIVEEITKIDFKNFLYNWYSQPVFGNIVNTKNFHDLIENRVKNDRKGLVNSLNYMGTGMQTSLWSRVPEIESEILYIAGEHDKKYVQIGKRLENIAKDLRLEIIRNSGHNTHFEQPEVFIKIIKDFLTVREV
jgi:2-succinyl-6-hydroxy-2,4-cyclohexadiene-1-carboxylate synthase